MSEVIIRRFTPADVPWIVRQHSTLYTRDEGFDDTFGPLVASILKEFVADHDPERERGWIAEQNGSRLGCIFCVTEGPRTAKLRLFLLTPPSRGKGLGKRLLQQCTDFAREANYDEMRLWTHESHRAACGLYRSSGWTLEDSKPVRSFGLDLVEQRWSITL